MIKSSFSALDHTCRHTKRSTNECCGAPATLARKPYRRYSGNDTKTLNTRLLYAIKQAIPKADSARTEEFADKNGQRPSTWKSAGVYIAKNMSEIIQNISDIFSIISLVFSICCGKFFTTRKKYFFFTVGLSEIKSFFSDFLWGYFVSVRVDLKYFWDSLK